MKTKLIIISIIAAAVLMFGYLGSLDAQSGITARQAVIQGQTVGEVVMNGEVLFRIRTSAGGLTPYQRAQIVVNRIEMLMGNTLLPEDVTTGRRNNMEVVLAQNEVIITADPEHARINQTTTTALADMWAQRLESVVAGAPIEEERLSQRIVPIISVGTGVRIGGAQVSGDAASVAQVAAVAQLEGEFQNVVRVRALIPVSSEDVVREIRRVPGTSVTALVDIRL